MAEKSVDLTVYPNERFGAIGQTGSGKSWAILEIIQSLRRDNEDLDIHIIDTKRSIQIPNFTRTSKMEVAFASNSQHVIFRPGGNRTKPSNDYYEKLWNKYAGNRKRDCLLYLDEAGHVTGSNSIPDGLRLLVQAGREQGIGVWWACQEPTGVNNALISQSEKMYIFRIPVATQREKLINRWGDSADAARALAPYIFIPYGFPEIEPIVYEREVAGVGLKADIERVRGGGR